MSVSPAQKRLKPPPVPETPTVTRTSGLAMPNSAAIASVIGKTVLEPSTAISPANATAASESELCCCVVSAAGCCCSVWVAWAAVCCASSSPPQPMATAARPMSSSIGSSQRIPGLLKRVKALVLSR